MLFNSPSSKIRLLLSGTLRRSNLTRPSRCVIILNFKNLNRDAVTPSSRCFRIRDEASCWKFSNIEIYEKFYGKFYEKREVQHNRLAWCDRVGCRSVLPLNGFQKTVFPNEAHLFLIVASFLLHNAWKEAPCSRCTFIERFLILHNILEFRRVMRLVMLSPSLS